MLLVENVLHEFLNDFLNKRNLPFPDGRMLYAYQMNQREYLELKEKLNELCQNEELVDLLRNKDFSRCFVCMLQSGGNVNTAVAFGPGNLYLKPSLMMK